jgi:hypothetical protein
MMIRRCRAAYDRLMTASSRGQAAARTAAWYSALPQKRRELVQDSALALVLAVLNLLAVLVYLPRMHPAWLALSPRVRAVRSARHPPGEPGARAGPVRHTA